MAGLNIAYPVRLLKWRMISYSYFLKKIKRRNAALKYNFEEKGGDMSSLSMLQNVMEKDPPKGYFEQNTIIIP